MYSNRHHLFAYFIIFAFLLRSSIAMPLFSPATLRCTPATWKDIVAFFLTNYIAHAATVPCPPGMGWWGSFQWSLGSLLYPFAGLGRAASIIATHCIYGEDDLGKALSVGAFAVAARTEEWKPPIECSEELVCEHWPSQFMEDAGSASLNLPTTEESPTAAVVVPKTSSRRQALDRITKSSNQPERAQGEIPAHSISNHDYDIHGNHNLPYGYQWVTPSTTLGSSLVEHLKDRKHTKISQSPSLLKMLFSVGQLIAASITIYRTRGSQLDRYGYAAFGLSVFPYVFMSLVNLICIGCMGDFPCLFILQTLTLEEAKGRPGALISGEVGKLQTAPAHGSHNRRPSNDAARSDEAEEPIMENGVTGGDDKHTVQLWTEDGQEQLCVRIGHSATRRFKLVNNARDATFIFRVHPVENRLRIYESNCESNYEHICLNRPFLLWMMLPRLWNRFRQIDGPFAQIYFGFNAVIAITSPILALILPYILISCLTGFRKEKSTTIERLVMIWWIVAGQMFMSVALRLPFIEFPNLSLLNPLTGLYLWYRTFSTAGTGESSGPPETEWRSKIITYQFFEESKIAFGLVSYIALPLAGFVVVAKMIKEFGSCSLE